MVELSKGAEVSHGGISIGNNGSSTTTTVNAHELATGNLTKVENAHVAVESDADTTVDYQLVNSSVENRGSGKLTVTHAQNSISSVRSQGGAIDILNVDTSDAGTVLKLASLELYEGVTLGVYTGGTVDAAQEAWVQVSGSAVFGKGPTINADLELMEGCSLTLHDTVDMGSNLRINGTITLDGDMLAQIQMAEVGASFDLFTGIDNLYLSGVQYDSITLSDGMTASTYFVGLEDSLDDARGYRLAYASAAPGEGVLSVHVVTIPEPTSTTLSLLALAALVARRRRK